MNISIDYRKLDPEELKRLRDRVTPHGGWGIYSKISFKDIFDKLEVVKDSGKPFVHTEHVNGGLPVGGNGTMPPNIELRTNKVFDITLSYIEPSTSPGEFMRIISLPGEDPMIVVGNLSGGVPFNESRRYAFNHSDPISDLMLPRGDDRLEDISACYILHSFMEET